MMRLSPQSNLLATRPAGCPAQKNGPLAERGAHLADVDTALAGGEAWLVILADILMARLERRLGVPGQGKTPCPLLQGTTWHTLTTSPSGKRHQCPGNLWRTRPGSSALESLSGGQGSLRAQSPPGGQK
ncbi:hypothetical protein NDU88_004349 [Pleurodeles waltl]|uniref:Uncharacterized protein n=1 Tax=Pleurodeles waltl TaxID=8319 RepID=A0AAV7T7K8_PLEWA|nr:hypothetical protein NDU88_004349 [Pleurodeles waltl]